MTTGTLRGSASTSSQPAMPVQAFAVGLATLSRQSPPRVLDTYYPVVNLDERQQVGAVLAELVGHPGGSGTVYLTREHFERADALLEGAESDHAPNRQALRDLRTLVEGSAVAGPLDDWTQQRAVVTFIGSLADQPIDAHDVYLRLHLLSHRKVRPHGANLDGVFGLLNNVAWTNLGPLDPADFEQTRLRLRARGHEVRVRAVDKFPRMTDYVIPGGVRIGDADRVRLGAHLAEGTTVMHEGFVNYNAGTLGTSMVEGRISAGVVVGDGTDLGGSASIMGTLSGGGKQVIRVGERCLLGANAGVGISLGNGCTVEAGLYVTAGSRVTLPDGRVVKAVELSGQDDLLFRRNSQTGAMEVLATRNQVVLNQALHSN